MSIRKAATSIQESLRELRRNLVEYLLTAAAYVLFVWTQDLVPLAGPILSSVATTFLIARLFAPNRLVPARPILILGLLWFPVNVAWTILSSLYQNSAWTDLFSIAWSLPLLFAMAMALETLGRAVKLTVIDGVGVDAAIREAWMRVTKDFGTGIMVWITMTILFSLSLSLKGAGFLLVAPFGLALLKARSYERASLNPRPPASDDSSL